ncbi:MAG: hypothetical protein ACYSSJ_04445 [Planctomycetota bacterium]|jgi:acetyl-CoA decarbonylase/synthase complex subunit delta
MVVPKYAVSFSSKVNRVTLGATKENGGTRTSTVTVGGAGNVVYGGSIEDACQKPVVAMDVLDVKPDDWPDGVTYSCLADHPNFPMNGCGLLTEKLSPKKAFLVVAKFQRSILKR